MVRVEVSVVDSKGRILINKRLREKYGIRAGTRVLLVERNDGILIKPVDTGLERLSEVLEKVRGSRDARRRAEEWLLREARKS